jgi:hypothetical protein
MSLKPFAALLLCALASTAHAVVEFSKSAAVTTAPRHTVFGIEATAVHQANVLAIGQAELSTHFVDANPGNTPMATVISASVPWGRRLLTQQRNSPTLWDIGSVPTNLGFGAPIVSFVIGLNNQAQLIELDSYSTMPGFGSPYVSLDSGSFQLRSNSLQRRITPGGPLQSIPLLWCNGSCTWRQLKPVAALQGGAWFARELPNATATGLQCDLVRVNNAGVLLETVTLLEQCASGPMDVKLTRDRVNRLRVFIRQKGFTVASQYAFTINDSAPIAQVQSSLSAACNPSCDSFAAMEALDNGDWISVSAVTSQGNYVMERLQGLAHIAGQIPPPGSVIWRRTDLTGSLAFSIVTAPDSSSVILPNSANDARPNSHWLGANGDSKLTASDWTAASFDPANNLLVALKGPINTPQSLRWFDPLGTPMLTKTLGNIRTVPSRGTLMFDALGNLSAVLGYGNAAQINFDTVRSYGPDGRFIAGWNANAALLGGGDVQSNVRYFSALGPDDTAVLVRRNLLTGDTLTVPAPCQDCERLALVELRDGILMVLRDAADFKLVLFNSTGLQVRRVGALVLPLQGMLATPTAPGGDLARLVSNDGITATVFGVDQNLALVPRYSIGQALIEESNLQLEASGGMASSYANEFGRRFDANGVQISHWAECGQGLLFSTRSGRWAHDQSSAIDNLCFRSNDGTVTLRATVPQFAQAYDAEAGDALTVFGSSQSFAVRVHGGRIQMASGLGRGPKLFGDRIAYLRSTFNGSITAAPQEFDLVSESGLWQDLPNDQLFSDGFETR